MHGNAQNLSEKLRAKFPATTRGYSMTKVARRDDAFSEGLNGTHAQLKVNHCSKKITKGKKKTPQNLKKKKKTLRT